MKLPKLEQCEKDQFLMTLYNEDSKGILGPRGKNISFLVRRRINYSIELLKEVIGKDNESPIADFACGPGHFGVQLAEQGYNVDFLDNEVKFFDYIKLIYEGQNDKINYRHIDISNYNSEKKYKAIFFGEALEHMEKPQVTLEFLRSCLLPGGILCLTTPNGDFVNCYEPNWSEVKDNLERNAKLANTIGNHVCEFTKKELSSLVKEAGFGVMQHKVCNSDQISKRSILRRILPEKILWKLDKHWSNKKTSKGKDFGRIQIVIAQRFH